MPVIKDLDNEIKIAKATLATDPTFRFPIVSKVNAPSYCKLLEDAIADDMILSHKIEEVVTRWYKQKDQGGPIALDDSDQEIIRTLANLWGVVPETALRKLVHMTAQTVLENELDLRHKLAAFNRPQKQTTGS